jgi:hypothetical protein
MQKSLLFVFLILTSRAYGNWSVYEESMLKEKLTGQIKHGTVIQLASGSLYEVSEYTYRYEYVYAAEVIVLHDGADFKLLIDGIDEPLMCRQVRSPGVIRGAPAGGGADLPSIDKDDLRTAVIAAAVIAGGAAIYKAYKNRKAKNAAKQEAAAKYAALTADDIIGLVTPSKTQTEVLKLVGQPELRNTTNDVEVWRYPRGGSYALVAFRNGEVVLVDKRPIPAAKTIFGEQPIPSIYRMPSPMATTYGQRSIAVNESEPQTLTARDITSLVSPSLTPEDVLKLVGNPELKMNHGAIDVWRYRVGDELALIAFKGGVVVQVEHMVRPLAVGER